MKTNFTKTISKAITVILFMAVTVTAKSQSNMLNNPNFSNDNSSWNYNNMNVEVNAESSYGGSSNNNKVAEIDAEVGLRQRVSISKGKMYVVQFKASRRTSGGTISNPGIVIRIYGQQSNTHYVYYTKVYTNTTFSYQNTANTFTIPANSSDNYVIIEITSYNNNTTLGVVVDNFQMNETTVVLPVTFINFYGEVKNNTAALSWTTENEMNASHYVIEKSADGVNYTEAGTVAAANTGGKHSYTFNAGTVTTKNYYRIRQVDISGAYAFSTVVILTNSTTINSLKLYPTNATSIVNYNIPATANTQAKVFVTDSKGSIVSSTTEQFNNGVNAKSINIANYNKGIYYVKIVSNDGNINMVSSFVKL